MLQHIEMVRNLRKENEIQQKLIETELEIEETMNKREPIIKINDL